MFATITYFYKKKFADFSMGQLHKHPPCNVELMYVRSGKCRVITDECTIALNSGNYIILSKQCPHCLEAQNANIMNIEFYIREKGEIALREISSEYPTHHELFSRKLAVFTDSGKICDALKCLIDELEDHGTGLCAKLLFKRFIIELCRNPAGNTIGGISYISKAKEYINEHLCEKITIDDIARYVNLNGAYMQTVFKQFTGKTVIQYINTLRIEKACFILKNHNLPLIDVAIDCGFASRQHFMYTFKKHTGLSVGQYRKKHLF